MITTFEKTLEELDAGGWTANGVNYEDIVWKNDGKKKPTKKEFEDKKKELEKQYADNEYQRKRLEEYNAIGLGEQLDMIYHDIDAWKAKIKAVKDKYPKP